MSRKRRDRMQRTQNLYDAAFAHFTRTQVDAAVLTSALERVLHALQPIRMTFDGKGGTVGTYLLEELDASIEQSRRALARRRPRKN